MSGLSPAICSMAERNLPQSLAALQKTVQSLLIDASAFARSAPLRKSMQFARLDLKSIALLNRGAGADIACASRGC
jgi:hypothetical protein